MRRVRAWLPIHWPLRRTRRFAHGSSPLSAPRAEEIVANKVNQFARNRLEIVHAIARKSKVEVPVEVGRFFEAIEAGRWDEIEELARHCAYICKPLV